MGYGYLFGDPHNKDFSILEVPLFWGTTCFVSMGYKICSIHCLRFPLGMMLQKSTSEDEVAPCFKTHLRD